MATSLTIAGRTGLYLTVFICGASVMVVELLGTRLIAPFYGASLYVWTSLISVAMIALSIGYFIGGLWADRAQRTGLSLIIASAAMLILLIPILTRPILLSTDPLGLRAGAFVSALVLFLPCLTFLGMVSPFTIKMATTHLDGVGSSAGKIYAVSTIGSVIGTLGLGFFLFPKLGSHEILISTGCTLLLIALLISIYEKLYLSMPWSLIITLSITAISLILLPSIVSAGQSYQQLNAFKIRSEQESLYGWVRVIDQPEQNLRFMTSDASMIGASTIDTEQSLLSYQTIVSMIPSLSPGMQRGLIIGLGAGHMSKTLWDRYGMITDTLEIDPAVAEAAVDYFDYQATGQAMVADARYQIRHLTGPYDLIIHDCFTGGTEPAHLLTVETLRQLDDLLSERGILAINFVAFYENGNNKALASVAKTIAEVFPYQSLFISEPDDDFNDFIFLASHNSIDIDSESLNTTQSQWLTQRMLQVNLNQGDLLTDNLNPLEHLQIKKSEHYRAMLVELFGNEILIR